MYPWYLTLVSVPLFYVLSLFSSSLPFFFRWSFLSLYKLSLLSFCSLRTQSWSWVRRNVLYRLQSCVTYVDDGHSRRSPFRQSFDLRPSCLGFFNEELQDLVGNPWGLLEGWRPYGPKRPVPVSVGNWVSMLFTHPSVHSLDLSQWSSLFFNWRETELTLYPPNLF